MQLKQRIQLYKIIKELEGTWAHPDRSPQINALYNMLINDEEFTIEVRDIDSNLKKYGIELHDNMYYHICSYYIMDDSIEFIKPYKLSKFLMDNFNE